MAASGNKVLTIPQAVELLRDHTFQDTTAEQLAGLRELIERTPTCLPLLGGRRRVEQFLKDAERSLEQRAAQAVEEAAIVTTAEPAAPRPQRPLLELGLLAVGLLIVVGGICTFLFGTGTIRGWFAAASTASTPEESPQSNETPALQPTQPDQMQQQQPLEQVRPATQPVAQGTLSEIEEEGEPDWNGWRVEGSPGALALRRTIWRRGSQAASEADGDVVMVLGARPASLSAKQRIDAEHRWLRIELAKIDEPARGDLEIAADGRVLSRAKLEPAHVNTPLLVALDACLGRTVQLELRFLPENTGSAIAIKSLTLAPQATRAAWTPLQPTTVTSLSGATLSILPDGSALAGGSNSAVEIYDVTASLPPAGATAVKLDALPDASLPGQGPGRAEFGAFLLTRFSAVRTASVQKLDQVPARYVRIELYGPPRALTLAEVEVFSGGQNVARKKTATQSSTIYGAVAGRAVDGLTRNGFKQGSVTHTNKEPGAWWAVDLGQEYPVEKIVVYGRGGYALEQANHRIVVTDGNGQKRWQFENPLPPDPSFTYGPFVLAEQRVEFSAAAAEQGPLPQGQNPDPASTIRDGMGGPSGWTGLGAATVSTVVYTIAPQQPPLGGQQVTFRLTHSSNLPGHNLGRFRLWSTTAPPPHQAEPAVIILATAAARH